MTFSHILFGRVAIGILNFNKKHPKRVFFCAGSTSQKTRHLAAVYSLLHLKNIPRRVYAKSVSWIIALRLQAVHFVLPLCKTVVLFFGVSSAFLRCAQSAYAKSARQSGHRHHFLLKTPLESFLLLIF